MRESRHNEDGSLDEVVADDVANFHLEQMDTGSWWIGLDHKDGTTTHIRLFARRPSVTRVDAVCEFDV